MIGANEEPKSAHRQTTCHYERQDGVCAGMLGGGLVVLAAAGGLPPCATRSRIGKAAKQQLQLMLRREPSRSLAPVHSSTCTWQLARDNGKTTVVAVAFHSQANDQQTTSIVGGLVIQSQLVQWHCANAALADAARTRPCRGNEQPRQFF